MLAIRSERYFREDWEEVEDWDEEIPLRPTRRTSLAEFGVDAYHDTVVVGPSLGPPGPDD